MTFDLSDAPKQTRAIAHREAAFQEVAVPFIRKVLLQPMFLAATVNENEMTDNARARAKKRGMASGLPDLYIAQYGGRSMWQELKWGKNKLSDNQEKVASAIDSCGIIKCAAWSIHDILRNLRDGGFSIHASADVLAQQYQAMAEAAVRREELKAATKNSGTYKPKKTRPAYRPSKRALRFGATRLGL